jgi:transcriptional regulator with XRE-family HTH domain
MKKLSFGERLAQARQAQGWTQMSLAEKAHISLRTIQRIESGHVNPRAFTIRQLSQIVGLDFREILENPGNGTPKNNRSGFGDMFNLKTKTMKKVTIFTLVLSALCLVFLLRTTEAQDFENPDYSRFTKVGERGVIYFLPRGEEVFISNVKDTADCTIGGDKIQQYKNKIFLNGNLVGIALKSDSVIYRDRKIIIKSPYWIFTSSYGQKIHYLIPNGVAIDNVYHQNDTENLYVQGHHLKESNYDIWLDGVFQFKAQPDDMILFRNGMIELLE